MECHFEEFLTFVFGIPSAYPMVLWRMFTSLVRLSLMPWISWFPISSCHLELSAFHFFTGYIFKKASCYGGTPSRWKAWKQILFQVWLFLLRFIIPIIIIVVLSPNLCNQKKDLSNELRPFLFFMDDWQSILNLVLPESKIQHHLVRIKWLPFDWIVFSVNSQLTLTSQDTEQAVVSCLFKLTFPVISHL